MADEDARHMLFIESGDDEIGCFFPQEFKPALQHEVDVATRFGQAALRKGIE